MSLRFLKTAGVLAFLAALALAPRNGAAQTTWSTLAPKDGGFSIDVPGEPQPGLKAGSYRYTADGWAFFVEVDEVTDTVREFVGAPDRGPIKQYLETIRKGLLGKSIERTSSRADFDGFPSVRFSADGETDDKQRFEGKYWLLVTDQHFYTIMAIGPRGSSHASADRFIGSFRLVKTAAGSTPAKGPAMTSTRESLAAVLTPPMLAVALLITEERFRAPIDEIVQNAQSAARLGNRWSEASPAWQRARTSITGRMARIAQAYEQTGEMQRTFDDALAGAAPGSRADALVAVLNEPAGPAILREQASMQYASIVMADDPNGPKPGEPAWMQRLKSLRTTFDQRLGSVMPRDAARDDEVIRFFATPTGEVLGNLWMAVVGRAAGQITGAVNLMLFDERDAINRDIAAAVATVK